MTVLFLVGLMGPLNIGYLFLRPYEEAAFAAFYRDVRDEKREIEEIEMRDKWVRMSRRKVKMRELCLYKNEIICIELCLCKDRRNNKNL